MRSDLVLVKPLITEKTMQAAQDNKYTFIVAKKANKNQISHIVEQEFKVNVIGVSTILTKGKIKKFGAKRVNTKLSDTKKAIVSLKKGQKIDLFDIKETK